MNMNEKRRVLETVCGAVMGKYVDDGKKYRLWIGRFNPDTFCPLSSTVGTDTYFSVDDKNEKEAINTAYDRLQSAMVHQIKKIVETSS